jgi:hypothetical protein
MRASGAKKMLNALLKGEGIRDRRDVRDRRDLDSLVSLMSLLSLLSLIQNPNILYTKAPATPPAIGASTGIQA